MSIGCCSRSVDQGDTSLVVPKPSVDSARRSTNIVNSESAGLAFDGPTCFMPSMCEYK